MNDTSDPVRSFMVAALPPKRGGHSAGDLTEAEAILAVHPEVGGANIFTAAILGHDAAVRRFLAADSGSATVKGGPYDWDALTHLCFSRYLKIDRLRTPGFVAAATALLDAGADANTGWWEPGHQPKPEWEPALYGACGIAHHPELTKLLLARGANPNDGEVVYHSPESDDNRALRILLETGKILPVNLHLMLIRKHDWHDLAGARLVLEHGADPNLMSRWGDGPMHHAISRDNDLDFFQLLLDYRADPYRVAGGRTAPVHAAHRGRGDILRLFERRGVTLAFEGVDRLIAACALGDARAVAKLRSEAPALVPELLARGGPLLGAFAGMGNTDGIRCLFDLGVPVDAPYAGGDSYWGVPDGATALQIAAWRARYDTVQFLIAQGAEVDRPNSRGDTALILAVRAATDSYWTWRRSPESVERLLAAGASPDRVPFPTGYPPVDALLRRYRSAS